MTFFCIIEPAIKFCKPDVIIQAIICQVKGGQVLEWILHLNRLEGWEYLF